MQKYAIKHSNTDVRKLWNLSKNGMLSKKTVERIFENDVDGMIVFNSKYTYEKFKQLEFTTLAMY